MRLVSRRTTSDITGAAALIIFAAVVLRLFGQPFAVRLFRLTGALNPIHFTLTAAALSLISFITMRGYRKLPFFILAASGYALIIISLDLRDGFLSGIFCNDGFNLGIGVCLLVLARFAAGRAWFDSKRFFRILLPAAAAVLVAVNIPGVAVITDELRYQGEIKAVTSRLNPAYKKYSDEINRIIGEKLEEELENEEQELLVAELNERIAGLEEDLRRFEAVRQRNEEYRDEIKELKERIGERAVCEGSGDDDNRVRSYAEAVRSDTPCVRDFAVKLASSCPGAYCGGGALSCVPGSEGIAQIAAIHKYVAGGWKYVSDPLFTDADFKSPADRTLAIGMAGDCDDFAILIASCIEAVGGRARILHGSCSSGGHAWAEVYVGTEADIAGVTSALRSLYRGKRIGFTVDSYRDEYWLSLDWSLGEYSCGDDPRIAYQS